MTLWIAIVLGVIQGIGEFLPISSSGHLLLFHWLVGNEGDTLTFDVALHMGTLLAIIVYFWQDIIELIRGAFEGTRTQRGRLAWGLVAGTVPAALAGFFFEDLIESVLRSPLITAAMLALWGVLLYLADRNSRQVKTIDQVGIADLVKIGLMQMFALIPGTSRSGATMTGARWLGLSREAAARASFLLALPITAGAGVLKLKDLAMADLTTPFLVGVVTSAVVGYFVIRFLLDYLKRGSFFAFALYRVALAALIFGLYPFFS